MYSIYTGFYLSFPNNIANELSDWTFRLTETRTSKEVLHVLKQIPNIEDTFLPLCPNEERVIKEVCDDLTPQHQQRLICWMKNKLEKYGKEELSIYEWQLRASKIYWLFRLFSPLADSTVENSNEFKEIESGFVDLFPENLYEISEESAEELEEELLYLYEDELNQLP